MSTKMEDDIKRWTAKRKSALVLDIIQGKTTVAEASRQYDLSPSEVEQWVDDGKRGMENAQRANPQDVREQYERQLKDLQEAYGEAMLELRARKIAVPAGRGRSDRDWASPMIRQGLQAEGITVSIAKLCRWFGVPRRSVYYKPVKSPPKVDPKFVAPIKAMIEESPSFGYRTVAHLLGFNKNTVQRVFQLMGWQVRKRPIGFRPRIQAMPSVASKAVPWNTPLIARFGTLGRVPAPFLLRSDNGLVFTSRSYTALARGYGLRQEFITPHCPQQNGMVERVIRTFKEQCAHRHRFENIQHASRVVGDWIRFTITDARTRRSR